MSDNDRTLDLLVKQTISHAQCRYGDVIAPSGMIDGMVKALREGLDQCGVFFISPFLAIL